MPDTPATPDTPAVRRPPRARSWAVAGVIIAATAGGVWWYTSRPLPPEPPALPTADGADPAVVAAVEKARQKVLSAPTSAADWGELGMTFAAHGYEPEADRCFAEAQRLDPAEPRWPYLRGVFAVVNAPDQAIPLLRQTIDLKPRDPEALSAARLRLAESLLAQQDPTAAEAAFREVLDHDPRNARARFGLGQLALTRGDQKAAREALAAVAQDPFARKRAAILLAALAREGGDLTAATGYEEAARDLPDDPSWPDPYLVQLRAREVGRQGLLREVTALEAAGQFPRAAQLLTDMVQSDPTPRLLVSAGVTLGKLREYARAEEMFRECLRREPDHPQARYFLAVMLFEQADPGRPDDARPRLREAAEHAARAVALKPDHGLAWLYLGRIRLVLGELGGAVEALRQAVACRPEYVDPHLYLAEALAADGKAADAVGHARNAQKLARPDDARPGQLLERLGAKPASPPK